MIVSAERVYTPPSVARNGDHRRTERATPNNLRKGPPLLPLSSPAISKRIANVHMANNNTNKSCHNGNKNQTGRRRSIFPFLPKTPEETPHSSTSAVSNQPLGSHHHSPLATTPPRRLESIHGQVSPTRVSEPALPFLGPTASLVEPPLIARASTLSSQDSMSSYAARKVVSFEDPLSTSDHTSKGEDIVLPALPSILKSPRRSISQGSTSTASTSVETVSSVGSDLPSLGGSSQSDSSCEELRRMGGSPATSQSSGATRGVAFDPRIWVREFERSTQEHETTWYSPQELEHFKVAAIERIMAFTENQPIATGTGRVVPQRGVLGKSRALFSHQALGTEIVVRQEALFRAVLQNELRRILVVDSHDIFLRLFEKSLRPLLPHADIVLADSAAAALDEAVKGPFDLIIVEERLSPPLPNMHFDQRPTDRETRSGTALMERLQQTHGRALYIAVSTKFREDFPRLQAVGDLCWSKPPPHMNTKLVRDLLRKLLVKRQRFQAIAELYSTTPAC